SSSLSIWYTDSKKHVTKLLLRLPPCRTSTLIGSTNTSSASLSGSAVHRREQRGADHDPVPREGAEAVVPDVVQKRTNDERRRDEREDEADGDLLGARPAQLVARLEQVVRERRRHRRHREEEREFRRRRAIDSQQHRGDDGSPRPRDAGHQRQRLAE